jgi:hypothetical protein
LFEMDHLATLVETRYQTFFRSAVSTEKGKNKLWKNGTKNVRFFLRKAAFGRFLCCETAGFSWVRYKVNLLNESLSMNAGQCFYTWQCETRHRQRKWCQDLLTWWNCLDVILKRRIHWPYITMWMILMSRLTYIYSTPAVPISCM